MNLQLAAIAHQVYLARFMLGGEPTKTLEAFLFDTLSESGPLGPEENDRERFTPFLEAQKLALKQEEEIRELRRAALQQMAEIEKRRKTGNK